MLVTVTDMYRYFLDGIRKEYTKVVRPDEFNRVINDWGMLPWMATRIGTGELDEKNLDDLDVVHIKGEELLPSGTNEFDLTTTAYQYYRMTAIDFKIQYVNNICGLTGESEWLDANIMRSDKRNSIRRSIYRQPKDSKLYYERGESIVRLITGTQSYATRARIDYYRYPDEIVFDETGVNNQDSIFGHAQNQEITDMAIKTYLERVNDPRYQSFLNEFAMNQRSRT